MCRALAEYTALAVTFYWNSATVGILSTTSVAAYVLFACLNVKDCPFAFVVGCFLAISASAIYMSHCSDSVEQCHRKEVAVSVHRLFSGAFVVSIAFYLAFAASHEWPSAVAPLGINGSETIVGTLSAASITCPRKSLASLQYWPGDRTYHAFDNVLLIVLSTHARYDANLDNYREVYSQFFLNVSGFRVLVTSTVGPGSREDAGFRHSYDILVDSYQSDEDLSDAHFYKMAGRMAHHMLYTAMKEHDCYDGYITI